ncbi:MAG: FliM/FliN family flagellar motor switch protein [Hyphomicrobiaceae bacterium]|nr:FliM/FliN family flagellar motor switch protein [Hyphomicrobiaceae bacterium]
MAQARQTKIEDMFGDGAGAVDRMPMIRVCLAGVGQMLFDQMKQGMAVPPRLGLKQCRSMTAEDAFALHGGPRAIAVYSTTGWAGPCYVTCNQPAAFIILEMLLGADPTEPSPTEVRPLSKVERRLSAVFFKTFLGCVSSAFMMVAETGFDLMTTWAEPDFDEVKPRSAMIVARFEIETARQKGEIHLLIPDESLANVREALSQKPKTDDDVNDDIWGELIRKEFNRSNVTVTAILDERPGTLGEIAGLRPGDILELNATTESQVVVETNNERLLWCSLGKSNGVYTLRVEEFVNKEQELMDNILAS